MAPTDLEGMVEVVKAIKAPRVVSIHAFGGDGPRRFLDRIGRDP